MNIQAIICGKRAPSGSKVVFNNAGSMAQVYGSSYSGAFSVTSGGSNLAAFAVIAFDGTVGSAITSVTYGGRSMTSCGAAGTVEVSSSSSYENAQVFYLVNPPTGSNTLAITGNSFVAEIIPNLVSFTGVNQTTPVRPGTYQSSGSQGTTSWVISSNVNDLTLTALESYLNSSGTNQTSDSYNSNGNYYGLSDHATTGAASITDTWTISSSSFIAQVSFSIQHA